MFVVVVDDFCGQSNHSSHSSDDLLEINIKDVNEVNEENDENQLKMSEPNEKEWNHLSDDSSPESSSGYHSYQNSGDETMDDSNESDDRKTSLTSSQTSDVLSDWDFEEFDPKNPYLHEPLTYPPDQELHLPVEVSKLYYIPSKSLPKTIQRKRISRSPDIKPKISKRNGRPKRNPQFLHPDSPSEGSDSD